MIDFKTAIKEGFTLLDYVILVALQTRPNLSRSEMETITGVSEATVRRATIRLREKKYIASDRSHPIGGAKHREARYFSVKQ
jgi:Fic family protein